MGEMANEGGVPTAYDEAQMEAALETLDHILWVAEVGGIDAR